jgi:hypothetical protein
MTEAEFRGQVVQLARTLGWRTYFTWSSIHSPRGLPDLVLCKPPRLVFAELKTDKKTSKVSEAQQEWLDDLNLCTGVEAYLWRPENWDELVEILR